ncbi:hypothetical protein Q8A67_019431 [Cirrhinus molitorella]|uniref:Uncharacterized protein n=1 Tax=Cirrhinus molitorella TaxID=172907 RepID=A0AA88P759_9TELE|nr:hypothetical protein Q8A67_019431 [Cirrhinus molitorella]
MGVSSRESYLPVFAFPAAMSWGSQISLTCPQEIGLSTLPHLVLQGTAVSIEFSSRCPPGNVVALRGSRPPRRIPEQPAWPFPAGSPLQDIKLAAWNTLRSVSRD